MLAQIPTDPLAGLPWMIPVAIVVAFVGAKVLLDVIFGND